MIVCLLGPEVVVDEVPQHLPFNPPSPRMVTALLCPGVLTNLMPGHLARNVLNVVHLPTVLAVSALGDPWLRVPVPLPLEIGAILRAQLPVQELQPQLSLVIVTPAIEVFLLQPPVYHLLPGELVVKVCSLRLPQPIPITQRCQRMSRSCLVFRGN